MDYLQILITMTFPRQPLVHNLFHRFKNQVHSDIEDSLCLALLQSDLLLLSIRLHFANVRPLLDGVEKRNRTDTEGFCCLSGMEWRLQKG